ncbi:MAG TPA: GNAT family N-acetyltransferase [Pyrinomonadaceae bacterium]|nr:GNAT family N-acetyltransferase [Pyrinomonadaceae bacterium]
MNFIEAQSADEIREARQLFHEYESGLGISLCFQNFADEVAGLPGDYSPPEGRLLLVRDGDLIAGCIALRKIGEGICEMKRLYVRPEFRGSGMGRMLAERIIEEARALGYERMRLDTLPGRMVAAIALYRSLGFQEVPAYYKNPVPDAIFMELSLDENGPLQNS